MASLSCLNVAGGDIKISFDKNNVGDALRAKRVIKDMLARGYALLIVKRVGDGEDKYERVLEFDEKTSEYIIADFDPTVEPISTEKKAVNAEVEETEKPEPRPPTRKKGGRGRLSMDKADAVGVARSAGG